MTISNVRSLLSFVGHAVSTAIVGNHHNMEDHVFTASSYGPSRLYYQGDVPILELQADDPYKAGRAHGYLLGGSMQKLFDQLNVLQMITGMRPETVSRTLASIRRQIPQEYLDELKGIVDGFNVWRSEHNWIDRRDITEDELLLVHMMPDQCHFDPKYVESITKKRPTGKHKTVACTVVIDRDKDAGITFGRNMDWPSVGGGILGTMSLIINRKYSTPGKRSTVEVAFPGFIGTITGMNDLGVSVAMNVCSGDTREIRGMPATFFNRVCLETARKVDDVAEELKKHEPLGCYHLTVVDKAVAKSFHLFQGPQGCHVVRELEDGSPLIVTNCRYPSKTRLTDDVDDSVKRTKTVTKLFKKEAARQTGRRCTTAELVANSLSCKPVDCHMTIHKIVMYPKSKKLSVAFDNQFAGSIPLQNVDTSKFFTRSVEKAAPAEPVSSPHEKEHVKKLAPSRATEVQEMKRVSRDTDSQSDEDWLP